jgi:hypothetical protein
VLIFGGAEGIRSLDTALDRMTVLANRGLQRLGHFSERGSAYSFCICASIQELQNFRRQVAACERNVATLQSRARVAKNVTATATNFDAAPCRRAGG